VLKGALSLFARYAQAARPTEDLDLAARDLPQTPEQLLAVMQAVCAVPFGDGLRFDPASLDVRVINEGLTYPGVGIKLTAWLGASQATLQIDVSFGNVVIPAPVALHCPNLLLPQAVPVAVYPLETVVTEKFAALVKRGVTSTRMKDLYDLHVILGRETSEAGLLDRALTTRFAARGTPVADLPVRARTSPPTPGWRGSGTATGGAPASRRPSSRK
jgi:Nucleotidyl transferase AbiEii toxin, Type IV TA system